MLYCVNYSDWTTRGDELIKNRQQIHKRRKFTTELPQKAAEIPTPANEITATALLYPQLYSQELEADNHYSPKSSEQNTKLDIWHYKQPSQTSFYLHVYKSFKNTTCITTKVFEKKVLLALEDPMALESIPDEVV